MEEIEVFKCIKNFEDSYMISNYGRILSIKNNRILSESKVKKYKQIKLCGINGYKAYVHHLVAETFIDENYKSKGLVVNHIDRDKNNNNLYNLEIITQRENLYKTKKSTSEYNGVSWDSGRKKWRADIYCNKKLYYLGCYLNQTEASDIYQNALLLIGTNDFLLFIERVKVKHTSKYKGVSWNKRVNKWVANVMINGISKYLGYYDSEEVANESIMVYKKNYLSII